MTEDLLLVEKTDHIATLILNRPQKGNSLTPDMFIRLHEVLDDFSHGDEVRCVVIRGAGEKAFCSGYDVSALPTKASPEIQARLRDQNPMELAVHSLVNFPYPVIAMLNGHAFGAGCELAVCCDLRLAADDIRVGMPPAKLGIVYMVEGLKRFTQVLGFPRTREMFFSGRSYTSTRLKEMGLVNYLLPRQELETFTYELAGEIAGNAPLALKGTKRILNLLAGTVRLPEGDLLEAEELVAQAFASEDLKEGQTAFLEKRKPVFKGR